MGVQEIKKKKKFIVFEVIDGRDSDFSMQIPLSSQSFIMVSASFSYNVMPIFQV